MLEILTSDLFFVKAHSPIARALASALLCNSDVQRRILVMEKRMASIVKDSCSRMVGRESKEGARRGFTFEC